VSNLKTATIKAIYKRLIKPILFLQDPEDIHDRATALGKMFGKRKITQKFTKKLLHHEHSSLEQKIAGIHFKNPVGLSAGFDKDAHLIDILPHIGFGFAQIGSITNNPYEGNPKPRLHRLKKSHGIVVYYGLKNIGADKIIEKIKNHEPEIPLSISIAKTNCTDTADDEAGIQDYHDCLQKTHQKNVGDFFTINISCPNTFGGEPFTEPNKLNRLLDRLEIHNINKPIFLKMPVDLPWDEFQKLVEIGIAHNITGVIIGNLTKKREQHIKDHIPEHIRGGISGRPTRELCNNLISQTYKNYGDKLIIIGVGGIFSAEDAYEKIKRGASLIQLITGMIFEGPQLIGEINRGLVELLKRDGHTNISDAIGIYHKT